jgi:hypothetical protein
MTSPHRVTVDSAARILTLTPRFHFVSLNPRRITTDVPHWQKNLPSVLGLHPASVEQHMSDLTKKQFFSQTRISENACIPRRLAAIVAGLLMMMPFLTGCGGGGNSSNGGTATAARVTVSLTWNQVPDPTVYAYFVHYGRQSPGQPGSCLYESSVPVAYPAATSAMSATITNLLPNTRYYFTISAYNSEESACSDEVSIVTPPSV